MSYMKQFAVPFSTDNNRFAINEMEFYEKDAKRELGEVILQLLTGEPEKHFMLSLERTEYIENGNNWKLQTDSTKIVNYRLDVKECQEYQQIYIPMEQIHRAEMITKKGFFDRLKYAFDIFKETNEGTLEFAEKLKVDVKK